MPAMSEWWSYRPEDLLLFGPRAYWSLFELENAALWPLPLINLGLGAAVLALLLRPRPWSHRAIAAALAAAWAWVGWSFMGQRYATINWAAEYVEPLFYIEAALLLWFGVIRGRMRFAAGRSVPAMAGLALYVWALVLHPLTAPAAGRPLAGAEIAGIAPDPTAIATLGLLALLPKGKAAPLFMAVPLLWCLESWATLATMGAGEAWIPLAAALAAVASRALPALRPRPSRARRDG